MGLKFHDVIETYDINDDVLIKQDGEHTTMLMID